MIFSRLAPLFLVLKACLVVALTLFAALRHWLRVHPPRRIFRVRRRHRVRLSQRRMRAESGFTLIEIGVVLTVVAIMMGVAIPTISNVSGMQAKAEVNKLASNIRATRGHASVSGQTCRLAVSIAGNAYRVECAKGLVQARDPEPAKKKKETSLSDAEKMEQQIRNRTQWAASTAVPTQQLKGGLEVVSVWASHQSEVYKADDEKHPEAYLYFFPSGTSETANIVLRRGDDYYTLLVAPFAGRVQILPKKVERSEEDDDF